MKQIVILIILMLLVTPIVNCSSINQLNKEYNSSTLIEDAVDDSWIYLDSFPNYAPRGLPDFCQRQHKWRYIIDGGNGIAESIAEGDDMQITPYQKAPILGRPVITMGKNCYLESETGGDDVEFWNFCLLVSLANCFWWLDSKYEDFNGSPGDGIDTFSIVKDYGVGDDHSPENAPLLICDLAHMQGIPCYNKSFANMNFLQEWILNKNLEETFELSFYNYPTFNLIAEEIMQDKPVILEIYFYKKTGDYYEFAGNHFVSCAGVNMKEMKIAISDPFLDINNPIENEKWEESMTHNNPINVSHDVYQIAYGTPFSNDYKTKCWLTNYWPYYDFCLINWAMTIDELNNTHDRPMITGPAIARMGKIYTFTFRNTDSDVDEVSYFIDWGDNTTSDWTDFQSSDESLILSHIYEDKSVNTVRVKIKDRNDMQSRWGEHIVNIIKEKDIFRFSISQFIENCPKIRIIFQKLGFCQDTEFDENQPYMSSTNNQKQTFKIVFFHDSLL